MSPLQGEVAKRLTFAIISHPDAGKTTITEKLLLFGGAIHQAGAVKSRKSGRTTVSDFMEMEKQRGISITTSVMGFDYRDRTINLLDTPGHADFSEDTYRTLTAVDSALMVIDSVKGVEERTKALGDVCRMRDTPIITFLNKMDREGRDPIELLDQVEEELNIRPVPMSWPVGSGQEFKGVYSLYEKRLILFKPHGVQDGEESVEITDLDSPELAHAVGERAAHKLRDDVELVAGVYPEFELDDFLTGKATPVYFGSALNNFGVRELLDSFVDIAPSPLARKTETRTVEATEPKFTGFVFKIHANLDPKHRDRIAFLRVCSGVFERNKQYTQVRNGRNFRSANPTAFMAKEREIVDKAYPGDIIGLHDTGDLKIGDTITEGEKLQFLGIPAFSPTMFRKVINLEPLRSKQFEKGLHQLTEEGVAQVFARLTNNEKLVGVVGVLQFEVIKYRLEHEYKADCRFESTDFGGACWISSTDKKALDAFEGFHQQRLARDKDGRLVLFYRNRWTVDRYMQDHPKVEFHFTSEY